MKRQISMLSCVVLIFMSTRLEAKRSRRTKPVLYVAASFAQSETGTDTPSGADIVRKTYGQFNIGSAGLGVYFWNLIYFGARYEYFLASREYNASGTEFVDTLRYQTVGGELGVYLNQGRVFAFLTGGLSYPVQLEIATSTGSFTSSAPPLAYFVRGEVGIRLSRYHAVFIEGAYRIANLGNLANGGSSYHTSDFDITGLSIGAGLHFEF